MWNYHKETPCVTSFISNKLKCHVFCFTFSLFSSIKSENREYDAKNCAYMYENTKMIPIETTPVIKEGRDGGVW
jgi:hypothetical protein